VTTNEKPETGILAIDLPHVARLGIKLGGACSGWIVLIESGQTWVPIAKATRVFVEQLVAHPTMHEHATAQLRRLLDTPGALLRAPPMVEVPEGF